MTHRLIGSLDPLIHLLTTSCLHSFISFIRSFIPFHFLSFHSFISSLIHWFIDSLHHSCTDLSVHWFIRSVGIPTTICSFVDAPHNFNRSWLLHLKNSYGPLISYTYLLCSKLPPRRVPGIIWQWERGKKRRLSDNNGLQGKKGIAMGLMAS